MAPITLPSESRRADAFRVVGITSPVAERGFRRAFRVTPRSTTSRSTAVNSRVSSSEMKRDSDCSSTSSRRKPSSSETASFASMILPSRSETNTGSGAFLIRFSAYARALSSSRMSRSTPIAPITLPSESRSAEAFSDVGITSPVAERGLSTASRVTPRSTTSFRAAVNSRVSSSLMKRDSDCSTTSSRRKPEQGGDGVVGLEDLALQVRDEHRVGRVLDQALRVGARLVQLAHVAEDPDRADHLALGVAQGRGVQRRRDHLARRRARVEDRVARDAVLDHLVQRGGELARLLLADEARQRLLEHLVAAEAQQLRDRVVGLQDLALQVGHEHRVGRVGDDDVGVESGSRGGAALGRAVRARLHGRAVLQGLGHESSS